MLEECITPHSEVIRAIVSDYSPCWGGGTVPSPWPSTRMRLPTSAVRSAASASFGARHTKALRLRETSGLSTQPSARTVFCRRIALPRVRRVCVGLGTAAGDASVSWATAPRRRRAFFKSRALFSR